MNNLTNIFKKPTIRKKILLGFLITFLPILVLFFFSYIELNKTRNLSYEVLTYGKQVRQLNRMTQRIDSLEKGIDTFFVTPYSQYWTQAIADIDTMSVIVDQLAETLSAEQSLQEVQKLSQNLLDLKTLISQSFSIISEEADKKIPKSKITNSQIRQIYKLISNLKSFYETFVFQNADLMQRNLQGQYRTMQRLITAYLILFAIIMIIGIGVALFVSKSISRPIQSLKEGTDSFAQGEILVQVPVQTNDEIGDLTKSFNQMTRTLKTQQKRLVEYQLELQKEMAKEKKAMAERLSRSKKLEALGILAGGVAHDLNNVLSGVVSYPDLLLMQMTDDDPKRKMIQAIQDSGKKAATIIQDLLTIARRGVTRYNVVNINSIVKEYLASPEHKKLISYHTAIEVDLSLERELPNIIGSAVHLKNLIMNLVSNAAEAQPKEGTIVIRTKSCYLDHPVTGYETIEPGNYVSLHVIDHGHGIKQEDLSRIFEPFYTKKVLGRSGTGLGMTVVWGTVEDHNGYINIQSKIDIGTTIELFFPATEEETQTVPENLNLDNIQGNGESILVIDDMENQRVLATSILSMLGYKVQTVSSGEEAIHYMKENTADLIILDMIMDPGIDGYNTLKELIKFNRTQKTIIASGFAETDRVKQALQLGDTIFIKKPYRVDEIGIAIKSHLGASEHT